MLFRSVRIAGLAHVLPDEVVRSEDLEARLAAVYRRLHLHAGRLELMTGIRERRFFPQGTRPSTSAAHAGELALARSGLARDTIGTLIHASVCRDFLEPATASVVHHTLGLRPQCSAFDLSNACLGFANAMTVVASQIESGAIDAGLVVAAEDGRALIEATMKELLGRAQVTKHELKSAFASLTIGGGAAAMVLARTQLAPHASELLGATSRAATEHHALCHGDLVVGGGMWMQTDSEALLHAGNELARATFDDFLGELGWRRDDVERVVTHQVGVAHRKLLLESLRLDGAIDFPTVETLGNIGSVSLPLTLSIARERAFVEPGHKLAMLGIGSGLQCSMLAVRA